MRRVTPVILAAAGVLVALDIVGALANRPLGFPYPSLGVVSILVYLTVGLYGSWRSGFGAGVLSAVTVGLLDGTLGPLSAWMVGLGPIAQTITEPGVFAYQVAVVTATAAATGGLGALAGRWLERRRAFRSSSRIISR